MDYKMPYVIYQVRTNYFVKFQVIIWGFFFSLVCKVIYCRII